MSRSAALDLPGPVRLLHVTEVCSTNAEAMRLAAKGEPAPLWVVADCQTAGRGRSGRVWASLPGNLHASLLVGLSCGPAEAAQLSLLAGVAVLEAVTERASAAPIPGLRLKWPNDVLVDGAKLGGILVESARAGRHGGLAAVVGIGLNLANRPADLDRPATCLAAHGCAVDPTAMLEALAWRMHHWLAVWDEGAGFGSVREAWLSRGGRIGERLAERAGARVIAGDYRGLDSGGALLLRDGAGIEQRVTYGDVSFGAASAEPARDAAGRGGS
jgi:BirA family biotin operon repressor/biotin-[acetyl-CoA-carboxylase] ligase